MSDGVARLSHDHATIHQRVVRLQRAVEAPSDGLATELHELRDTLFHHFAREEEGLFPFLAEAFPHLTAQLDQMVLAHDSICGALARACHLAGARAEPGTVAQAFGRFCEAYASHSATEVELLQSLDKLLSPDQRRRVAAIVDGL